MNDDAWDLQSVAAARLYVRFGLDDGVDCPCCGQVCKLRKRGLRPTQGKFLIRLVGLYLHAVGHQLPDVPDDTVLGTGIHYSDCWRHGEPRDYANLGYYNLAVKGGDELRGFWFPTVQGVRFACGLTSVPAWPYVFNNAVYAWSMDRETIHDVLAKDGFDYDEVCASVGFVPSRLLPRP